MKTRSLIDSYKKLLVDKTFIVSSMVAIFLFGGSLVANYSSIEYASEKIGNSTSDLLLDYLPIINTDFIFSEGALIFVIFLALWLFFNPKTIPFTLKSVALFIFIRSVFVIMTHLGPIPESIATDIGRFAYISTGADLFFSGHTGMPFLLALIFWKDAYMRWIMISCSIIAAFAVIFGHLHYTIDVFSAFFIAYGIHRLAHIFFPHDYLYFSKE